MNNEELTQVGKQVTKQKRPTRSEAMAPHFEPGDNTKYINHSLKLARLGKPDLNNADEVKNRIEEYFAICADDDMKPSVAGLALAMSIDRNYLWQIGAGKTPKSSEVVNTIKTAMQILDLQMVDMMQNGKINPVSGIFLMKNNFGYADKQEVVVTPQAPLGDTKTTKELEQNYIDSVVDEEN